MKSPDDFDVSSAVAELLAALDAAADPIAVLMEFLNRGGPFLHFIPPRSQSEMDLATHYLFSKRGPAPGEGAGAGRPYQGIVEDAQQLWVTWIVGACKHAGALVPKWVRIDDVRVYLATVKLTFGIRHYFVCPRCHRRTETLFYLGSRWACRKCHHLGYASQVSRTGSPSRRMRGLFDSDAVMSHPTRRYVPVDDGSLRPGRRTGYLVDMLRDTFLAEKIAQILQRVSYDAGPKKSALSSGASNAGGSTQSPT
jgi:hypothetical protein